MRVMLQPVRKQTNSIPLLSLHGQGETYGCCKCRKLCTMHPRPSCWRSSEVPPCCHGTTFAFSRGNLFVRNALLACRSAKGEVINKNNKMYSQRLLINAEDTYGC